MLSSLLLIHSRDLGGSNEKTSRSNDDQYEATKDIKYLLPQFSNVPRLCYYWEVCKGEVVREILPHTGCEL
jgi:hypothetical protein